MPSPPSTTTTTTTTTATLAPPRRPQLLTSASAPLINTTTTTTTAPNHPPTKDDTSIPHNPHMLVIASHTAYRKPARTPSSILSKSASWINTNRTVDLSPNASRVASPRSGRSPVGTPVGTPRTRSPVRGVEVVKEGEEEGEAPEWVGRGWGSGVEVEGV